MADGARARVDIPAHYSKDVLKTLIMALQDNLSCDDEISVMSRPFYARRLVDRLQAALADTPVVLIVGPRQVGKSTLGRQAAEAAARSPSGWYLDHAALGVNTFLRGPSEEHLPENYLTLDDPAVLASVKADPAGFISSRDAARVTVIDEIQRAPELLVAIKAAVDVNRRPGRFLLTGSANVLHLPRLSESLAGRMEPLALWSLAQTEIERSDSRLLEHFFTTTLPAWSTEDSRSEIFERAQRGGFPEVLERQTQVRRNAWFASYITTVVQREVRDISNVSDLVALPSLLEMLAVRSNGPLNMQAVAGPLGLAHKTATRYIDLLEAVFLIVRLPAWAKSVDVRTAKSPKALVSDSGLLAHLLRIKEADLALAGAELGTLVETFVGMELKKYCSWAAPGYTVSYWRGASGAEIDYILEDPSGRVTAVEVKASMAVDEGDFKHIRAFGSRERNFHRGIVLYAGNQTLSFGKNLHAVPISALWREPK